MPPQTKTILELLSGGKFQTSKDLPTLEESAHGVINKMIAYQKESQSKVLSPAGKNIFGQDAPPFTVGDLEDLIISSGRGKVLWRGINPWVRGMVENGKFVGGGISTKFPASKRKYPLYLTEHKSIAEGYAKKTWEIIAEKARLLKKSGGNKGRLLKFDVPEDYISKHGRYIGYGSGEVRFDEGLPKEFLKKVSKVTDRRSVTFNGKTFKILKK
jgi:hypothetical protein|tara:strand:+ start:615 stop:1256 length:642 start_codon:yes stop_codon:yes gene_type:complete